MIIKSVIPTERIQDTLVLDDFFTSTEFEIVMKKILEW